MSIWQHITDEVIVICDKNQDILPHHNHKRDLLNICILIYISSALVKEIASVKTKYYKNFVPKQFTHTFYFNKNSNYWHEESVKNLWKHISAVLKENIMKCLLVKKGQWILMHLRDQIWSEQNIGNFWPSLIWPKYLNPEQQAGTLCQKMKPPHITMCLLNWKIIFKDTICLLFKDAK